MAERTRRLYAAVFALSIGLFAAVASAVVGWAQVDRLDVRFVSWVHTSVPSEVVDVMQAATHAGSVVTLGTFAIVSAALLARHNRPAAVFVVTAFAASQLLDQALKFLFRRARPELEDPFVQLTTYAFPSGHAFGAAATYGAVAVVLASAAQGSRQRALPLVVAAALVVVVAASRVVLGVHYLLDVLAGIVAGIALLSGLLLTLERSERPAVRLVLFRPSPGHEQPQRAGLDA